MSLVQNSSDLRDINTKPKINHNTHSYKMLDDFFEIIKKTDTTITIDKNIMDPCIRLMHYGWVVWAKYDSNMTLNDIQNLSYATGVFHSKLQMSIINEFTKFFAKYRVKMKSIASGQISIADERTDKILFNLPSDFLVFSGAEQLCTPVDTYNYDNSIVNSKTYKYNHKIFKSWKWLRMFYKHRETTAIVADCALVFLFFYSIGMVITLLSTL